MPEKGKTMTNQLLITSHVYTGRIKKLSHMTLPKLSPDNQLAEKHLIAHRTNRSKNYNKQNRTCTTKIDSPPICWLSL